MQKNQAGSAGAPATPLLLALKRITPPSCPDGLSKEARFIRATRRKHG